jgi:hypothetical protein
VLHTVEPILVDAVDETVQNAFALGNAVLFEFPVPPWRQDWTCPENVESTK